MTLPTPSLSEEPLSVICRPARAEDKADVIDLTSHIWEGHDYVPHVWDEWLADTQGRLAVAEYQGRVVSLAKLTLLSPGDWWMEGMRVHPDFEHHGIATQIHAYLMDFWQQFGDGTVSLATISKRVAVHRMCARQGFERIGEFTSFIAPALEDTIPADPFQPTQKSETAQALALLQDSPLLELTAGVISLEWKWARPHETHLAEFIDAGHAWWWRSRQGWLATFKDEDDDEGPTLMIGPLACQVEALKDLLLDFRRLAAAQGYRRAGWIAPLNPGPLPEVLAAGYERGWDESIYLFCKKHPGHRG